MCKIIFYAFVLFFFSKAQAQICGCGGPVQQLMQGPISTQEFLTTAQISRTPSVATTVIDNSVSNALANTLQLLIVSDLIASTLNPHATASPCMLPTVSPFCETLPPPLLYSPTIDVVPPRTEFVSPPCSPLVDILRPRCPCMESIPNFYGLTEVLPHVANIAPAYGPNLRPPCPCMESIPNFYGLTEVLPHLANIAPAYGPNFCGPQEILSPTPNLAPVFGPPMCVQEIAGPLQISSLGPNFCGGLAELISPIGNFGPVTTELIFPPGPMTCNVGYAPPPMPCANVNVEPMPYTGVSYFY